MGKIGRNKLCPCGSKKKYKKCCIKDATVVAPPEDNPNSSTRKKRIKRVEKRRKRSSFAQEIAEFLKESGPKKRNPDEMDLKTIPAVSLFRSKIRKEKEPYTMYRKMMKNMRKAGKAYMLYGPGSSVVINRKTMEVL